MKLLEINREALTKEEAEVFKESYPPVTDHQAEMMLHALGADNRSYHTYKGSRVYRAYRNGYDAGGKDVAAWDDLVTKKFARKGRFCYNVTVEGIHMLEFIVQCRIWNDYVGVTDCKRDVLHAMMERDVFCGYECWLPTTAVQLSEDLAICPSLIRDTLKALAEEGLVAKGSYGGVTDEGYPYCHHGWYLTEKAKELNAEEYKKLQNEEYERLNNMLKKGQPQAEG